MTWFEFKSGLRRQLSEEEEIELKALFEAVIDMSDEYEACIARLRATGRFKSIFGAPNARPTNMNTIEAVLSAKERREFPGSVYKTILSMALDHRKPSGLAAAISDYLSDKNPDLRGSHENSLLVPLEALSARKAQIVGTATAGGYLVSGDISSEIEKMLRGASVCVRAGARVLNNLRSDLRIGRETQEVTFEWLSELESVDESSPTYGVCHLSPRRISGFTSMSTQLNAQAPDLSSFVTDSLARGVGAAFDKAALQGTGVAGEPLGLFSRDSVKNVVFGGGATWAKAISFEAQTSGANAVDESIVFVANPNVREKWRNLQRFSGSSTTLWQGNECADRPAFVTTNCPSTSICSGDFSRMVLATWGEGTPVQIIVDPYTSAKSGKIEIVANLMGDIGVVREEVFCISTDSAIQ